MSTRNVGNGVLLSFYAAALLLCQTGTCQSRGTLDSSRPELRERAEEREEMVEWIARQYSLTDERVLRALRNVPRHLFMPASVRNLAYADTPLPIGYGQTISQPFMVAYMTKMLDLEPDDKVLEIGTGSGYQAAVLAELTSHVFTIEIIEPLGEIAGDRLASLGYGSIQTRIDDGYFGWSDHAPFDAIIVTAAAGHVPPPLVQQLAPGGKIVIPVGPVHQVQVLLLVTKDVDGTVRTQALMPVRFVPMTGTVQK